MLIMAGVAVATVVLSTSVQATPINGSISFAGTATVTTPDTLADATGISSITSVITLPGQEFGSYAVVGGLQPVTFTPFTFSASGVTPLWTFTIGSTTYDFNATSLTASFDATHQVWDIGGTGTAQITGFSDTLGTWNASVGASGSSFFFGSATTVPDGGATVMLLGTALSAIGLLRKKLIA